MTPADLARTLLPFLAWPLMAWFLRDKTPTTDTRSAR